MDDTVRVKGSDLLLAVEITRQVVLANFFGMPYGSAKQC